MNIAICSLSIGDEYKKWTRYTRLNKINYCEKHQYTFLEDESVYNPSKPIPWSKILLLLKYLKFFDYLVWIDSDILIMNNEIKLESFIEKYPDHDMICGSDIHMPNTGVWFIKNSDFSKQILKAVWNHEYDDQVSDRYKNWEQGSFIHLYDTNFLDCQKRISITYPTDINSYWYNYYHGHFILHFAGVRGPTLGYLISDYCPDRMDTDTNETYAIRKHWISGPFRQHLDERLHQN